MCIIVKKYKGNRFLLINAEGDYVVTNLKGIQGLVDLGVLVVGAIMSKGKLAGVSVCSNLAVDYVFMVYKTVMSGKYPEDFLYMLLNILNGSNVLIKGTDDKGNIVPLFICRGKGDWLSTSDGTTYCYLYDLKKVINKKAKYIIEGYGNNAQM